jgi:hypothetical protein
MMEYEYRVLQLSRDVSRPQARALLAEEAEYGRWELDRVRLFAGGVRKVRLRRRIIRVRRTA